MADQESGLYILDVSDPSHPSFVGSYVTPGRAQGLYISGNYAYVTEGIDFVILNIANPANPSLVGSYVGQVAPGKVFVSGNYAYVTGGSTDLEGLSMLDISDPANPSMTAQFNTGGSATDITVSGNYAFVAESYDFAWTQGIEIINISNPAHPVLSDSLKTAGDAIGLSLSGNNIYLADYYSIIILHSNLTGIEDNNSIPNSFFLSQNYPNPFNAQTVISYILPSAGKIKIEIYDLLGRRVNLLVNELQIGGKHQVIWDATGFPSGIYFARLEAGKYTKSIKLILLK